MSLFKLLGVSIVLSMLLNLAIQMMYAPENPYTNHLEEAGYKGELYPDNLTEDEGCWDYHMTQNGVECLK